jgi:MFS family permease
MTNRWTILAVLFFARASMAFQFQGAAALSPFLIDRYGVTLVEIGVLIGLYLAPGVVVALPGGAIAARFGEKRVVGLAMALMVCGAALAAFGPDWAWVTAGRVLAGIGGVVLNVVMTKMLVDWFAGREVATAMALFVNSWPVGIALGLVVLPWLAGVGGVQRGACRGAGRRRGGSGAVSSRLSPARRCGGGIALAQGRSAAAGAAPAGRVHLGLLQRGAVDGLQLWSRAVDRARAGTGGGRVDDGRVHAGLFGRGAVRRGPCGPERAARPVIAGSLLWFVLLMPVALIVPPAAVMAVFIAGGIGFALAAGPIMTLPASVLPPEVRTFGMGIFFTIYYVVMMVAPPIGASLAVATGTVAAAFGFGVALALTCVLLLGAFRMVRRTGAATA